MLKKNYNFGHGAESMNHQVINSFIGARMVLFFSILLLRVIIWCFECWFSLHEAWKLSSWSTMKLKYMQGTTTLSSKFTAEREYSRKWYPKKSTVKKLYKKWRKKGEYLRISIYICNTKLRDLLSQNPPSINNQQQKKREGSWGREREREIGNATEERVLTWD